MADGADTAAVIADVEDAIGDTPSLEVLDRDGFIGDLASQITSFVTVIYALLVLSIIIALIGIANTLSLSINERTRELGLLRAVGMHRGQLRSTVRWEAVLISLLGTVVGLGLGLLLSWALITALESQGLTSVRGPRRLARRDHHRWRRCWARWHRSCPSRRAARLAILDAIATE